MGEETIFFFYNAKNIDSYIVDVYFSFFFLSPVGVHNRFLFDEKETARRANEEGENNRRKMGLRRFFFERLFDEFRRSPVLALRVVDMLAIRSRNSRIKSILKQIEEKVARVREFLLFIVPCFHGL